MRLHPAFIASIVAACSLAALAPAQAANQSSAYQVVSLPNSGACAHACEEDGLCIAWTFAANGVCSLSAVAPQQLTTEAAAGFSTRAPSFARAQAEMRGATEQPVVVAEATPPPSAPAPATPSSHSGEMTYEEASLALLGGPEDDALRPRLGARP